MARTLFVVAALALGGCTFPQNTKMEPVGETQMQTANPANQPAAPDKQSTKRSGSSTNSTT